MAYSRKFAPLFDAIGWPYSVSPASGDAGAEAATRVIELLADPSLERMALETRTRGRASMAPILPALESLSLPR